MRRATTDEDRRPAIAVTSRAAPLLAIELLAGALHIAAFAGGTSRTTALFELPGHDAVQDVGAGVDTEDVVVQIDVGARDIIVAAAASVLLDVAHIQIGRAHV